jgi:hypothetical protein
MNGAAGAVTIPNGSLSLGWQRTRLPCSRGVGVLALSGFGQVGAGTLKGKLTMPDGPQCEPHLTRRCSRPVTLAGALQ